LIERICVVGLGRLGAPICGHFAQRGYDVCGLDLDQVKVDAINAGHAPVEESGLEKVIWRAVSYKKLRATTSAAEAVRGTQACIFVTPTPSMADGSFSNEYLLDALGKVAKAVYEAHIAPYSFIISSTVTPGTCDRKISPLLKTILGASERFRLVYKPEFIALGTVMRDLQFPDFHLIGESSPESGALAFELYWGPYSREQGQVGATRMSLIDAELTKISLNCFVTMKISYANQVAMIAEKLGADPHVILNAIGQDHRVGQAGLKPGLPFGGPCFPRDNRLFRYVAETVGLRVPLASAADAINNRVIEDIVAKILNASPSFSTEIGILGTAYKPGTNVTEESPASRIAKLLPGRVIKTHDPMASHSHSLEEVLACPILIVATAWPEYAALKFSEETFLIDPMRVIKTRFVPLQRRMVAEAS